MASREATSSGPAGNLTIASGQGDYDVRFWDSVESAVEGALADASCAVVDGHLLELYGDRIAGPLSSIPVMELAPLEQTKTLDGVSSLASWLLRERMNRKSAVVAIGGGIVQDVVTFTSHVFHRGMRWDFVPTTLLAMSDSCIGAKCGINHDGFKNQLGVFQAPGAVHVAPDFLATLDDLELQSGYGEVLKLTLTHGGDGFSALEESLALGLRNGNLDQLIRISLEAKREVIQADEYESDLRRVLNYGHTFGHALEALTNGTIPHGVAVTWGCDLINFIAMESGLLEETDFLRIRQAALKIVPKGISLEGVTAEQLIESARTDKKAEGDEVNLAVLRRPGLLEVVRMSFSEDLGPLVERYLGSHELFARA